MEMFGTLLAIYAVIRVTLFWELRDLPPKGQPWSDKEPGTPIDATKLTARVDQLRQNTHADPARAAESSKLPLLVEEKRREMQKLAYFQKPPPPPEPPEPSDREHDGGLHLVLI